MGDWQTIPLDIGLARLIDYRGKSPRKSETGIPVISAKVVKSGRILHPIEQTIAPSYYTEWMTRGLPDAGDVVMTTEGPMGEVAQLDSRTSRYALGQRIVCLSGKKGVLDNTFLKFLLMSPAQQDILRSFATGTTVEGISQKALRSVPITVPDWEAQLSIGTLLAALDDKIDLNRRMNDTLEAMARATFRDWFVDFGPTRAKMEGRAPYLAPDLWSLFPDAIDEATGLPEGWEYDRLLSHARLISGGTPKTDVDDYWSGAIAWASAKDVSQCSNTFLIATERTITPRGLQESATRLVPKGATVVVARGATTGRFCLFGKEMAMNQTCYALSSDAGRPYWLNCAFASLVVGLVHAAHGSVFDTITTSTLEGGRIIKADAGLMNSFEVLVTPLFDRILHNIEEMQSLAETRDYLLPKLMSGEILTREAETLSSNVA